MFEQVTSISETSTTCELVILRVGSSVLVWFGKEIGVVEFFFHHFVGIFKFDNG
jgi:hypothetical protein